MALGKYYEDIQRDKEINFEKFKEFTFTPKQDVPNIYLSFL
jgi:hypothetical protein